MSFRVDRLGFMSTHDASPLVGCDFSCQLPLVFLPFLPCRLLSGLDYDLGCV